MSGIYATVVEPTTRLAPVVVIVSPSFEIFQIVTQIPPIVILSQTRSFRMSVTQITKLFALTFVTVSGVTGPMVRARGEKFPCNAALCTPPPSILAAI